MTKKTRVKKALLKVVREWEHCQIEDRMGDELVRAALKAGMKLRNSPYKNRWNNLQKSGKMK